MKTDFHLLFLNLLLSFCAMREKYYIFSVYFHCIMHHLFIPTTFFFKTKNIFISGSHYDPMIFLVHHCQFSVFNGHQCGKLKIFGIGAYYFILNTSWTTFAILYPLTQFIEMGLEFFSAIFWPPWSVHTVNYLIWLVQLQIFKNEFKMCLKKH